MDLDLEAIKEDVLEKLKGVDVKALAVYGSTVAGYAKKDSDVDLLALCQSFKEKVRYYYFSGKYSYSLLASDVKETYEDAEKSALGEFVVGRLLNPYLPIFGEEELKEVEVRYKKRVILEETYQLYKEYQDFLYHMNIPLEYFLFSKLKKRYQIYPPALYSYANTYSKERIERNLPLTLDGFKRASESLPFLELKDGFVRVKKGAQIPQPYLVDDLYYLQLALKQYIFHGMSGKVTPDVVLNELVSKVKRSRSLKDVNVYLKKPEALLQLDGGAKVLEGTPEKELNAVSVEKIGGLLNPFYGIKVVESEGKKYVVKSFKGKSEFKWIMLGIAGRPIKPFEMNPVKRMYNEYLGSLLLGSLGINSQKVVAVSVSKKYLVKEYLDGRSLLDYVKSYQGQEDYNEIFEEVGKTFAEVHRAGFALGDSKPENFLVSGEKVFLIDLEQFKENASIEDMGWDIAEFMYYSFYFLKDQELAKPFILSFKKGYGESKEVYSEALEQKYLLPFLVMLRPDLLNYYRKVLKESLLSEDHDNA